MAQEVVERLEQEDLLLHLIMEQVGQEQHQVLMAHQLQELVVEVEQDKVDTPLEEQEVVEQVMDQVVQVILDQVVELTDQEEMVVQEVQV